MEVVAERLSDSKFEITARGHHAISDQPLDNGGEDSGMTPPEFLLGSLASCVAFYAAQYLKTRQLHVEELKVRVTAEKQKPPARLGKFVVEIIAPGLEEAHLAGIQRASEACLIHHTLSHTPEFHFSVTTSELAHA